MGPGKRTSSATVDEIHSVNNRQGFGCDGKVNTCSQSHDQSSVTCLHPSKFLKVEVDGIETHKMGTQSEQARKMVVEAPSVTRTDSTSSDLTALTGQVLGVDQIGLKLKLFLMIWSSDTV